MPKHPFTEFMGGDVRRGPSIIAIVCVWAAAVGTAWLFYSDPRAVAVYVNMGSGPDLLQLEPYSWRAIAGIGLPPIAAIFVTVLVWRRVQRAGVRTT